MANESIFKFGDKFGYESPFGDWLKKEEGNKIAYVKEVYLTPNNNESKLFNDYSEPRKRNTISITVVIYVIGNPHKIEVTHINYNVIKEAKMNSLLKRYELEINVDSPKPPKKLPTQEFLITLYNSENVLLNKQRFKREFSFYLPDRKTIFNVFYFDKFGRLIDANQEVLGKGYPHAIFTNDEEEKVKIMFQDKEHDHLQYSGVLEEGEKSDFRLKKPYVKALQFLYKGHFDAMLKVNDIFLNNMKIYEDYNYNNKFVNVFELAKDKKFQIDEFIKLINEGYDFGAYMFRDDTMYVTDGNYSEYKPYRLEFYHLSNASYIGFNSKNMGNFMFGMAFQILGYGLSVAQNLAHGWNLVKHGTLDSSDDQLALKMGYAKGKILYGKPQMLRKIDYWELYKKYGDDEKK